MKRLLLGLIVITSLQANAQQKSDAKMKTYVDALMKKMTLDEKIGQLNLLTPGGGVATGAVVSKGVEEKISKGQVGGLFGVIGEAKIRQAQELAVNSSRLKIPLLFGSDVIHGYKTTFPIPLGMSCSWDMPMIERSARLAATEATADGLNWAFSPMVDIARDPRWGRIAEGAGEDPYLGSQVAKAMVVGYQNGDLSKDNTLLACVKHFALYGAADGGRDYNTVDMSKVKMYNDYLPPYKAAVDAGVGSIMTSFNTIDNIPATGNKWLLTDLLRKQWGFKGMVVSDYTSVNEMIDHGLGDLQAVSALSLKAGLDMDMVGEGFLTTLKKSLGEGKVTQKEIDDACRRILEAKYKLGLFTDPFRYCNKERAANQVLSEKQKNAAREFATKSFVLLKNNQQALPLKKTGTIALVGPLANNKANMLGTWAVSGNRDLSIPVFDGMKNLGIKEVNILYAKAANISDDTIFAKKVNVFGTRIDIDNRSAQEMMDEAIAVAKQSDVIVAVVGEASEMSGESSSRSTLNIPKSQQKLLQELKKIGKPLVLVIMSGRPLDLNWEMENEDKFEKFKGNYLDVENSPLIPFGFGLSYSSFNYSDIKLSAASLNTTGKIKATVTVTNTGDYDGEEVIQLYTRDMVGSIARPVKELKGFQKIMFKKGESKEVSFTIGVEDLKFYNSNLKFVAEPGDFKLFIGGNSKDVKETTFKLVK
ncbi:MAG: glycoside hydrolase family 3 C-terminal domain-containing protein [Chitinophagaceae bacterium]|nr:glycoside hydrolase family 3 C-terminal domain-containing protein [Chitinophagaceae bacterium]